MCLERNGKLNDSNLNNSKLNNGKLNDSNLNDSNLNKKVNSEELYDDNVVRRPSGIRQLLGDMPRMSSTTRRRVLITIAAAVTVLVAVTVIVAVIVVTRQDSNPASEKTVKKLPVCTDDYCSNGGRCVSEGGAPYCQCEAGYTGAHCNSVLPNTGVFEGVKELEGQYDLPFKVGEMLETSQGDFLLVESRSKQAGIYSFDTDGLKLRTQLRFQNPGELYKAARQDDVLFIADTEHYTVHVIREDNTYIRTLNTSLSTSNRRQFIRSLAVSNNVLWVTTSADGIYKFNLDRNYAVTSNTKFAGSGSLKNPIHVSIQESRIVVVCYKSPNIHFFNATGHKLAEPAGGRGEKTWFYHPLDVVMDSRNRIYICDNRRVVLLSPDGAFIRQLIGEEDGLDRRPEVIYLRNQYLFIATWQNPYRLYVFELE